MSTVTDMNDVAIKATNLVKKFGDFPAVDHISFEVNNGEIFGFLGPNGAARRRPFACSAR